MFSHFDFRLSPPFLSANRSLIASQICWPTPSAVARRPDRWSYAALPARPSTCRVLRAPTFFNTFGETRCLVMRSAGFYSPGTLLTGNSFRAHCSWSHRTLASRCLTFDSPFLSITPFAARASMCNWISIFLPRSFASVAIPNASVAPRTTA